jgi:excisionase family DNA binding protein
MSTPLLSVAQSAAILGVVPATVRRWLKAGRIGRIQLGRRVLIEPSEIDDLIARNRRPERKDTEAR